MRSSANLKSFLNGNFTFFIYLKMITWILKLLSFSVTHTHKFGFQLRDTPFHCLNLFSGFSFQSNPHREDPFLILGNTRFHNWFHIWIVTSFKSNTRLHRYNSYCIVYFFFCNIRTAKISYNKKDIFHTQPPKQNLDLFCTP